MCVVYACKCQHFLTFWGGRGCGVGLGWNKIDSFCDKYRYLRPVPNIPCIFSVSDYHILFVRMRWLLQHATVWTRVSVTTRANASARKDLPGTSAKRVSINEFFLTVRMRFSKHTSILTWHPLTVCVGFGTSASGLDCAGLVIVSTVSESWHTKNRTVHGDKTQNTGASPNLLFSWCLSWTPLYTPASTTSGIAVVSPRMLLLGSLNFTASLHGHVSFQLTITCLEVTEQNIHRDISGFRVVCVLGDSPPRVHVCAGDAQKYGCTISRFQRFEGVHRS